MKHQTPCSGEPRLPQLRGGAGSAEEGSGRAAADDDAEGASGVVIEARTEEVAAAERVRRGTVGP